MTAKPDNNLHLIKRGKFWYPADQYAEEWSDRYRDGHEIVVASQKIKNPKEVRWYFAMLREVLKHTDNYRSTEELRSALLIAAGCYDWRRDIFGRRYEHPHSFTDMDDETFRAFKERSLQLIEEHLGIDANELMREVDGTQKWVGPLP